MPKTRVEIQQRKRRKKLARAAPFPVPIATITGEDCSDSNWIYYKGMLTGSAIVVAHTGDMDFLYRMGFFGKGELSRGQPEWTNHWQGVTLPSQPGRYGCKNAMHAKVTSRRRFLTHLKWFLQANEDEEGLKALEQDFETVLEDVPPNSSLSGDTGLSTSEIQNQGLGVYEKNSVLLTEAEDSNINEESEVLERTLMECGDPVGKRYQEKEKVISWDDQKPDAEFWGMEPAEPAKAAAGDDWATSEVDSELGGVEDTLEKNINSSEVESLEKNSNDSYMEVSTKRYITGNASEATSARDSSKDDSQESALKKPEDQSRTSKDDVFGAEKKVCISSGYSTSASILSENSSLVAAGCSTELEMDHASFSCKESDANEPAGKLVTGHSVGSNERGTTVYRNVCSKQNGTEVSGIVCLKSGEEETHMLEPGTQRGCSEDDQMEDLMGQQMEDLTGQQMEDVTEDQTENVTENQTEDVTEGHTEDTAKHTEMRNNETNVQSQSAFSRDTRTPVESALSLVNTSGETVSDLLEPSNEYSTFCADDDSFGNSGGVRQFVVADSDEEECRKDGKVCRLIKKWRPVVKMDPFPVKENLQLGYEEAFFLSYGLGCLSVVDSNEMPVNLASLWKEFCQRQPSFLPTYIAYHYYRSKNWVPKTGLKFGCTFLLYKDGPPFYHASYSVVVKFVDTEGKAVEGYGEHRRFTWTSLAGLKRITEHVGKELMMCYVIKPKAMSREDMMSPSCIPSFQVKEMVVSRWVSSQEREGKALEEIP